MLRRDNKRINGKKYLMQGAFHKPHSKCIDAIHNILLLRHCVAVFFFNFAYSPLYHAFIYLPLIFYQFCFVLSQYNWVSLLLLRSNALFFCIFQFKKRLHAIIFMKRTQNTSFIARFFLWITWFGSLSSIFNYKF